MKSEIIVDKEIKLYSKYPSLENYYDVIYNGGFLKNIIFRLSKDSDNNINNCYTVFFYDRDEDDLKISLIKSNDELIIFVKNFFNTL